MKSTTTMLKAFAVVVISLFFSSSLLPQGDIVRSSSLLPQNSNNCIDLEFEQDGVLPSSQGFTYLPTPPGIPEGSVFSVSGGLLHINTIGTGGVAAGYLLPNAFNPSQDFTLEFRMKVFPGTGPFGIDFEVSDDVTDKDFEFGFVPDGIFLPPPPAARPFFPFNTVDDFHTYKVFSPGGTHSYQFFIDGVLVVSGTVSDGDPGSQRFIFGDLTGGSDGRADVDFIKYCQSQTVQDDDNDGVPDTQDNCPNSIVIPTVVIGGCDSGVPNTVFPNGCTISDRIQQCGVGAQNHGQFVSCVAHLTNELKQAGVITGQQKGAIQSCAAQSNIP